MRISLSGVLDIVGSPQELIFEPILRITQFMVKIFLRVTLCVERSRLRKYEFVLEGLELR